GSHDARGATERDTTCPNAHPQRPPPASRSPTPPLMPVRRRGKDCYQWGTHGRVYCGPGAYQKAARQGRAAYSRGYRGEEEMDRKLSPRAAGADYAHEQLAGSYFQDWVWEQMVEAERMRKENPDSVMPL